MATEYAAIAEQLATAYTNKIPVPPLTTRYPEIDLEDAYAIQQMQVARWVAEGRGVRGHKVGLTSQAMQRQLGVTQPDYGVLLEDFFHAENSDIDTRRFVQPRIEPEVAFLLRRDLGGPGVHVAEAFDAIAWVFAAIEIIDSRIEDWNIGFLDTIADNASSGGVVLGTRGVRIGDLDLRLQGVNVRKNGELVATGVGAAVLGSPVNALVWLANTLGKRDVVLKAGQVILPGSMTRSIPVEAGATISADYGALGTVTARFI